MGAVPDVIEAAAAGLVAGCSFLSLAARNAVVSLDRIIERDRTASPAPTRSVLVLNDEAIGRETMEHMLAPLGVPIILASTVAEARAALNSDRPPAAIVADYYLGAGETCAALLRDRRPRTRAVIVTGAVDVARIADIARGCGADLRDVPITTEAQHALCDLVRSYLPPEAL